MFRTLGPLGVLEDGQQVVQHRTRALRARPADLARFIEEQRAPPGSSTFAPGRPAAHLGKFGDRVRGSSPDRPHAGETPSCWQRSSPGARFDRPLAAESDESRQRDDDRRSASGRCPNARNRAVSGVTPRRLLWTNSRSTRDPAARCCSPEQNQQPRCTAAVSRPSFSRSRRGRGARPSSRTRDRLQPAGRRRVPGEWDGLQMGRFSDARGSSGRHDCLFIVC